ncbi:flagellar basal-body MS-ring/collar protein FliF [Caulobacter radicis]|uniref:Flagellar M-ring protein FliF n=1 Tax=Caulobacter radicis TaxID=2172650 RepID=A0A2T9JGN8_9CAUL|nr:flagellar basal-body MS-ring/collar protein FliF [Caulobacter radicis]PVM82848.1 flagellar M-ring protein FliF [Caulobacter radicis]
MTPLEQFRTASPSRQIAIVATGVVVLCAVFFAVYWLALRKPYGVLFTNLRDMDAATIVGELDKKKVPYKLADHGATILVPQDQVDGVRLDVMSQDLPLKGMVGFELFNKSDMGLTEFAQKINYQRALQGELARTIMTLEGIETARVHLSLAEQTIFRGDRQPAKASVTLAPRTGQVLSPATVRGVQRLVAAAVSDLKAADVVVLDGEGQIVSPEPSARLDAGSTGPEADLTARVRGALSNLLPDGRFQVLVLAGRTIVPDAQTAPGARSGIRVDVTLEAPASPELQQRAKALAEAAIGADPAAGDLVTVTTSDQPLAPVAAEPTTPAIAPAIPAQAPAPAPPRSETPFGGVAPVYAGVLLVALLAVAFLLQARRPGRRLNAREKEAYARRLKALLDERDAVASPRV